MIEQIKQALEDATPEWHDNGNEIVSKQNLRVGIGGFLKDEDNHLAANAPDWIRYLLGEVERLKQSKSNLLKQYHERGKDNDKVIYDLVSANTELQKALEWYADEANHKDLIFDKFVPYTAMDQDEGERARQALKGSEPK